MGEFFVQAGIFQADSEMLRIEDPPGCHREHPIKEGAEDGTYEDEQLIQKVRDFLFMNYEDIEKIVYGTPENAKTRASHTAEDMLANRAVDSGIHSTAFLNQDYYAKESSQHIQTWVKAILGL